MELLDLSIVTPQGTIFEGGVKTVTLPGSEGEFGVLPGHADTVALLRAGVIEIEKDDGKSEMVAVNWGYSKVSEKNVDVIVDGAVAIHGKDGGDMAAAISSAKELIKQASDDSVAIGSVMSKIDNSSKSNY